MALLSAAAFNVLAVRGPEGAVVIDAGDTAHADAVERLARRAVGSRRIATVFNTHWHHAQTGGNARLASDGAPIIAHENTRLWLGAEIWVRWQDRTYDPAPPEARPTETFYTTGEMDLGAGRLHYGYIRQAHTDGDIYVRLIDANVIAAGGVVSGAGWPIVDWSTGGWYGGMVDGIEMLLTMTDENTIVIPANGPALTQADLAAQHAMHTAIFDRLREDLRSSRSPDEVVARAPTAEFDAEWGDPELFVRLAFESLWGHVRTDGRVRAI